MAAAVAAQRALHLIRCRGDRAAQAQALVARQQMQQVPRRRWRLLLTATSQGWKA